MEKIVSVASKSGAVAAEAAVGAVFRSHYIASIIRDFKGTRSPAVARAMARRIFWHPKSSTENPSGIPPIDDISEKLKSTGNPLVVDGAVDLAVLVKRAGMQNIDTCDILSRVASGILVATAAGKERASKYHALRC